MITDEKRFVIRLDCFCSGIYYSSHGYFKGRKQVMSYSDKIIAKRFLSKEKAVNYINNCLPKWAKREKYIIEKLTEFEFMNAFVQQNITTSQS